MKKILLFIFFSSNFLLFGQTEVYSDNFDDEDISDWTLIDSDGDGNDWTPIQIVDASGAAVGTPVLRSFSWESAGPLNPDNWAVSPAIDLSNASGAINLNYQVMAIDEDWDAENYTVYVATGNAIADFTASSYSLSESTLDGINTLTDRTLNISGLAGSSAVYIAFRHHGVSDQFSMEIDNVSVEAETLSTKEVASAKRNQSKIYPNPVQNVLNLKLSPIFDALSTEISIINSVGENIGSYKFQSEGIDVSNLFSGTYLLKISDGNNTETSKFIKK